MACFTLPKPYYIIEGIGLTPWRHSGICSGDGNEWGAVIGCGRLTQFLSSII